MYRLHYGGPLVHINDLLKLAIDRKASDLQVQVGRLAIDRELQQIIDVHDRPSIMQTIPGDIACRI
jgi:hypothetical protein